MFEKLPIELNLDIFSFLNNTSLASVFRVNTMFFKLTRDEILWHLKLKKEFNITTPGEISALKYYEEYYKKLSEEKKQYLTFIKDNLREGKNLLDRDYFFEQERVTHIDKITPIQWQSVKDFFGERFKFDVLLDELLKGNPVLNNLLDVKSFCKQKLAIDLDGFFKEKQIDKNSEARISSKFANFLRRLIKNIPIALIYCGAENLFKICYEKNVFIRENLPVLHIAIENTNLGLVKWLVEKGEGTCQNIKINDGHVSKLYPLMSAIISMEKFNSLDVLKRIEITAEIVEFLLMNNADPDQEMKVFPASPNVRTYCETSLRYSFEPLFDERKKVYSLITEAKKLGVENEGEKKLGM